MKRLLCALGLFVFSLTAMAAIDVNTASQAQLEALNGIGPAKAKAIVDYRTKNGAFKSVDDLDKVSGIGKATLEKIRKDVAVGGAKPVAASVAAKPAAIPAKK